MSAPQCLYCGASGPWWECGCPWAQEAQTGKRSKPRVIYRGGRMVLVLDEEAALLNPLGLDRYVPVKPLIADEAAVRLETDLEAAAVKPGFDRVAYMREYMRKKRTRDET